jgi:hypothetical protein
MRCTPGPPPFEARASHEHLRVTDRYRGVRLSYFAGSMAAALSCFAV